MEMFVEIFVQMWISETLCAIVQGAPKSLYAIVWPAPSLQGTYIRTPLVEEALWAIALMNLGKLPRQPLSHQVEETCTAQEKYNRAKNILKYE